MRIIEDFSENLKDNLHIRSVGIIRESMAFISDIISKSGDRDILLITDTEKRARELEKDFISLGNSYVKIWEKREEIFYSVDIQSREKVLNRLSLLFGIINNNQKKIIISTPAALLQPLMKKDIFYSSIIRISLGEEIPFENLKANLIYLGYEFSDMVESAGQFSVRGGILDIFSPGSLPVRIEFFDDEVDSIRNFDIDTQKSVENLKECMIFPAKEWLFTKEEEIDISKEIKKNLDKSLKVLKNQPEAYDTAEEKFGGLIEKLSENISIENTDLVLPFENREKFDFFNSYISDRTVVIFEDIVKTLSEEDERERNIREEISQLILNGEWLSGMNYPGFNLSELMKKINYNPVIFNSDFAQSVRGIEFKEISNWNMRNIPTYGRNWELFFEELSDYLKNDYEIIIYSGSDERKTLIERELSEREIAGVKIIPKTYSKGFVMPDYKKVVITEAELFDSGRKFRDKKLEKKSREYLSFKDLKEGEYVVHENYGIGIYEGVKTMEVDGVKKDFLSIAYSGSERLYVPIEQLRWIQKYISSGESKPKVTKLSSEDWSKKKSKVKRALEEMAEDLVLLYAKRANKKGYAFSPDRPWQKDFEDDFPYEETQGQLRSTEEIKEDMESFKVMDRLLLGDVGYGKTEVALRAAFKAISDGKQVAFLVPTTILAEQHYNVMRERFKKFPVICEVMSRFTSKKAQKDIAERISKGLVDMVVGTHRILSEDVKFKDLGLIIVDEEQRFGVRQKDKLKELKENVDVLTLSATPIPRTLNLSLSGIRDISVLDEPPEDRFPIQTYVSEYSPELVRSAIIKEIERGGQVYYLYNQTESIASEALKLSELVPEAKVRYAHGKMSAVQLEKEMADFLYHKFDVLVCTTIIETGIDIPNVNTIIITDADRLGLSQLYQLRGRVGRSNRVAFGYMTYPKNKVISEVASKRLRAIREFTKFGSGYKIAIRDLQIRGAGNLLGESQHGHMAEIGYDLYVKFLNQAIKKSSGEEIEEERETLVDLDFSAFIPENYIESDISRMEIYKKISSIEDEEDKSELIEELIDRFGEPDEFVINLMEISLIRYYSEKIGAKSVREREGELTMDFYDTSLNLPVYNSLVSLYGNNLDYNPKKGRLIYRLKEKTLNEIKNFVENYRRLAQSQEYTLP